MSKFIGNIFSGNTISNSGYTQNMEDSMTEFIKFNYNTWHMLKHDIEPLYSLDDKISFSEKICLNGKFKCINWFEYEYSNSLRFLIIKIREYNTNKIIYIQFPYLHYRIFPKSQIDKDTQLTEFYRLALPLNSTKYSPCQIFKEEILKGEKLYISHYKKYGSKNSFFKEKDDIMKHLNNVAEEDYVIFATHFQLRIESECGIQFGNYRYLYVINDISPSCSFELKNFELLQSDNNENIYFLPHRDLKKFFMNKITESFDVNRTWISFDIESECSSERAIDDPKNIMTHLGFEYFSDLYYSDYKKHKDSFNFCFINTDFYIRQEQIKNKSLSKTCNRDVAYYNIMNTKDKNTVYKKELDLIKNRDDCIIITKPSSIRKIINKKSFKTIRYVFCTEQLIVETFLDILNYFKDVDCLLTYNGHSYDFQQMSRRYCYLADKVIKKELSLPSLYNDCIPLFGESKNQATAFNIITMKTNNPYYSVDIFNYVQKFKAGCTSFSLKEVAKNEYNIDTIIQFLPLQSDEENKFFKLYFPKTNKNIFFRFIQVLLSSNYCYINDIAYKICDKDNFIKEIDNLYDVDIDEICGDLITINGIELLKATITISNIEGRKSFLKETFRWSNYQDYVTSVCLAKDDIEIANKDIFDKQSVFDIARYCVHDSLLCRYLMKDLYIKENNDTFSQIYYLPQSQAFLYRSSTNFLGYLLYTCYRFKKFLFIGQKIDSSSYSGGHVFEPTESFLKDPVMLFDFESLYPSIISSYNISPDVLVLIVDLKDELEFELVKNGIKSMFPSDQYTVVYNTNPGIFQINVFTKIYSNGKKRKGLLGIMLDDLKIQRKQYKKKVVEMREAKNVYQEVNCDLIQNSIKIMMNAVYGLLGSNFHSISCKFTSQSVTLIGSFAIQFIANYLDGCKIQNDKLYITNNITYNDITKEIIKPHEVYDFPVPFKDKFEVKLIYGDTDSVMLALQGVNKIDEVRTEDTNLYKKRIYYIVSYVGNRLNLIINDFLTKGVLNMEFESIYFDMIIMSKKKYKSIKATPKNKDIPLTWKEIDSELIRFVEDNKGISLKRRDNCRFQKRSMEIFFEALHKQIHTIRFKESKMEDEVSDIIIQSISQIRKQLFKNILEGEISVFDFLISSSYTGSYKNSDNPVKLMVEEYNKTARDPVVKGDRFNFFFQLDYDKNNKSLEEYFQNIEELPLKEMLTKIGWNYITSGFTDYKRIYDDDIILSHQNGTRIYFEIYLHKLYKDIETVFNNLNIYKKLSAIEKHI